MDFKEKIESKGLKKKWVAEQVGISHVLLSYYINGVRHMPDIISNKLRKLLS